MPKITKKLVDALQPKKSRLYFWDSEIRGFGLLVLPTGVKSYCYQYRTPEGKTERMTIGKHGTFTPDMARDKALELRRAVEQGRSPLQEKRGRRAALTVSELLSKYLASAKFAEKAGSTRAVDRGRIERHLKPLLGRKIADKLTSEDVRKAFAAIVAGKTARDVKTGPRGRAIVKGGEGAARMAIRLLKSVYAWGIETGLMKENPAKGVKVGRDGQRDAIVESAEQYAAIFETIAQLENTLQLRRPVADAIRVIALTGARRGEIAGLRWRHVDLKKGVIALPRKEHKTGRKTDQARIIGLPAAAQAIIANQPGAEPDDFIFPPARGEGPINLSKPWRLVRQAAGLRADIGLHGLRHSLATFMAVDGLQAAQIMSVMGHRDIKTSQRYVHIAEDMRVKLAERAAAGISAALTGSKPAPVAQLKKA